MLYHPRTPNINLNPNYFTPEGGGNTILQNIYINQQNYTESKPTHKTTITINAVLKTLQLK
jgi:hypothetical protein